jgi:pimeloyl-ACP methyl ester carboxylesterase
MALARSAVPLSAMAASLAREEANRADMTTKHATLHGHEVCYRAAGGRGPLIVLVHGIAGTSETWDPVLPLLADRHTVIAPDLLGHGKSGVGGGDFSLGAYASGMRDLLAVLGHERATFVGHSLGGGVAMQFAYQFPEMVERLVLVSSGGLGKELNALLRSAALPGAEYVLPLLFAAGIPSAGTKIASLINRVGFRAGSDLEEIGRSFASLGDTEARMTFIHTVRGLIDPGGQRVDATNRLYLAADTPTLIVWGALDAMIPVEHADAAHRRMPGSRLEIFEQAGHFPHLSEPGRFADVLSKFIAETEPAKLDARGMRKLLARGSDSPRSPGRRRRERSTARSR